VAAVPELVVVDYSAPNIAKEMHVGHLRTTVIGDSLCRLLEFQGHRVERENHVGDWGTPFGMLIEHLVDLGEEAGVHELSVGDLDGFYRGARLSFDADEAFRVRSRARVVLLQSGEEETLRLRRLLVDESVRYFDEVYARLGVLLEDSDIVGESFYNPMLPDIVEDLRGKGLIQESDGAACVFPTGFTNREGDPLPLIVQKSDEGFGYAATDLAAIRDRVDRIGANRILYVVGAPQAQHFQMVFATARLAGWLPDQVVVEHVAFGNVLGRDHKMLKSRSGEPMKLLDLLDEAVDRAAVAVGERTSDMDDLQRATVATLVGIGAVKYSDLATERTRDYVFDSDSTATRVPISSTPTPGFPRSSVAPVLLPPQTKVRRSSAKLRSATWSYGCSPSARRLRPPLRPAARASCAPICSTWPRRSPRSTRIAPFSMLLTPSRVSVACCSAI
jgi:arginyl-tRNA synthetase